MIRLCNPRGITLIESVAAMAILAIIAAGAATGTIGTMRGNLSSRTATVAAALIHDKIEQLRALDPTTNPADLTAGTHNDALNPLTELGAAGGIYSRSWTIVANSPRQGLADVKVTVTWKDPRSRTLSSATYLCLTATCT
jgi:prepilin-type N-terminal cleavage/methylation domain-containing protein